MLWETLLARSKGSQAAVMVQRDPVQQTGGSSAKTGPGRGEITGPLQGGHLRGSRLTRSCKG